MVYGEKFNAVTHVVAAALALPGAVVLVVLAALDGDAWKIVSVAIYGVTLVLLYTISALYHSLRGRAKHVFQKLDHQSIYLLIAGSYTPFCLVTLRDTWGWQLLAGVWGLAIVGSLQELLQKSEARILSVIIYVVMGGRFSPLWPRCALRWARPDSPGSRLAVSSTPSASSSMRSTRG